MVGGCSTNGQRLALEREESSSEYRVVTMEPDSGNAVFEGSLPAYIADPAPVAEDAMDISEAADLDSQPLNDLGVSVIDQDVLERNVAAQVSGR